LVSCVKMHSATFNVEPAFVAAVLQNESGKNWKCGPLGKKGTFVGPGGIKRIFQGKHGLNIYDPSDNIKLVAMSFQGLRGSDGAKVARLKKYNPLWRQNNYLRDVMAAYRGYKRVEFR
jgi:hypothetical protein